jgi:hypothetical protein
MFRRHQSRKLINMLAIDSCDKRACDKLDGSFHADIVMANFFLQ